MTKEFFPLQVICVAGLVHQQFPLDGPAPKRPYQNYFVGTYDDLLRLFLLPWAQTLALTKPSDCILPSGLSKAAEAYVSETFIPDLDGMWILENEYWNCSKWTSVADVFNF